MTFEHHTIELPWYFVLEPPDLFIFNKIDDLPVMVAESKELAKEYVRKHSAKQLPVTVGLQRVDELTDLLALLKSYMAIPDADKPVHIGLKHKTGRVGKIHIPTLIAQIEEMERPGPTTTID